MERDMNDNTNPQFLTLKEFVQRSRLSDSTVRRRARDGSLSVVQLGGKGKKLLFPVSALQELRQRSAPPQFGGDVEHSNVVPPTGTPAALVAGPRPRWARNLTRRPVNSQG
jgi:hypothetical protein